MMRWTAGLVAVMSLHAGATASEVSNPMIIRFDVLKGNAPVSDATAPWVTEGDNWWTSLKPAFTVGAKGKGYFAETWLGITSTAFHLRVAIDDKQQVNAPDSDQLWAADGLEIGLDMRGDRSGRLPKDAPGVMGPDDAKFLVAMGPNGVVGRCVAAERDANLGLLPSKVVTGSRDDKKGKTVYELSIPWERFDITPGMFPTFGMAIQFNDLNPGTKERVIRNWGEGTFGDMKPGLFKTVAIGAPKGRFSAMVVNKEITWTATDAAEVVVAVAGNSTMRISAAIGQMMNEQAITGTGAVQRIAVRLIPGSTDLDTVPFRVTLLDSSGAALQERVGKVVVADAVYRALQRRIDAVLDTATHPLFRRHLLSVKAIVASEWSRLMLYRETGQRGDARKTLGYLRNTLAGFRADVGNWATYRQGKRDLYMSRISPVDRSVQFYVLTLPKNWDSTRTYPLFVELHGAGNDNPMADVSARLGADSAALDLKGYSTCRTYVQSQGSGYYIMPFGRGNIGYRGPGEDDVWEAYDDVHRLFAVDSNRTYLFGFSMGGGGTWSLGVRTPDRWAAIMIMAGGLWSEGRSVGLGRNISYLPTYIWCGEKDPLTYENVPVFKAEIEKYGGKPVIETVPGIGHDYTAHVQQECAAWLQQHVRARPDSFTYVADTDKHLGVWGITMVRDLRVSGLPWFTCAIKGAKVAITSEGTPGLTVALGKDGLGLSGDISVEWNGAQAYAGPVKTLTLGEVPKSRRTD